MSAFIEMNNIAHSYNKESVLKEVDLSIPEGQLFGLLGPSGSGKTTLVKIMIGLLTPTNGIIHIDNQQMPSFKQMQKIGYMAQSDALYSELTARENLYFFASIYKIPKKQQKERVTEAAKIVDLQDHLDKTLEKYSGGMKRRMSLAVALLHQPNLLILDEPTVGIDPVLRASIWEELRNMQKQGTTIIITTHVMDEAEKCDNLALLRDGYVIAQGSPQQLKSKSNTETLEEAFLQYGGASHAHSSNH
ncbi:ABC-2 type transport system ATP-binding protein [Virgibacillus subterraneus]|uniref:ABC-2 type transport system ATP-binding protein n=1 Tax=Virgibacillus subterraneus TaxID=621109 RepID=A0A1H9AD89_9BACI|nr:ABC transporter ATP-binding protein [Virgibacillus subterraneus]SEP74585.1 ABC-2 type transport system ATP-binding protein [Virgibacillus subterraneus]